MKTNFGRFIDIETIQNNIIENGNLDEFLAFAKSYNIFQESKNNCYQSICAKIRQRLQKEKLDETIIRPENK